MNTAQQNIATLPAECYSVLLSDKSLIKVRAGESGYYHMNQDGNDDFVKKGMELNKADTTDQLADILNEEMGVTKGQRKAMESGSMWGWGHRAADVNTWTEEGEYISQEPIPEYEPETGDLCQRCGGLIDHNDPHLYCSKCT